MKPGLKVGAAIEYALQVQPEMQAQFNGMLVHPLYSTASMIQHLEWAARQHILPFLEPGEEGVGYHIDVKHLQPTPIGETVILQAVVQEIQERRVICAVKAWQLQEPRDPDSPSEALTHKILIGEGTITQALVPVAHLYRCLPSEGNP
ncbi:MAG: thioesterase [Cyanobacteria bacterium]|nr:thioesterase [Cyanobacteriota bacterium]